MTVTRSLKFFRPTLYLTAALMLMVAFWINSGVSFADSPQQDLETLSQHLDKSMEALQKNDITTAQTEFKAFSDGWYNIEDSIKNADSTVYHNIEDAMSDVKVAFAVQPVDANKIMDAEMKLDSIDDSFIQGTNAANTPTTQPDQNVTIKSQLNYLDTALTALSNNNTSQAAQAIKAFETNWPSVETLVMAKSADVYNSTENNMALAYADLQSNPPKTNEAQQIISQMRSGLAPYAEGNSYGIFDATIVLFREGMEALLVITALLTFLAKSNNTQKQSVVWLGAGIGLALSIVVAVIIELFFSNAAAGSNREIIEGATGLVAATMLFYMSYWLHSKSQVGAWQKYIKNKATSALATGSAFSLGLLAFLAVFREGSETAILYLGIAPSIALSDLLIGLGIGVGLLGIMATLILVVGIKLPMRPFFMVASILVFYLGFKFIGAGIHSLQVSQILPAHSASFLPSVDFFGIYPTWETTIAQVALLVIAVATILLNKRSTHASKPVQSEPKVAVVETKPAETVSSNKTNLAAHNH